jgi:hypothetical protein
MLAQTAVVSSALGVAGASSESAATVENASQTTSVVDFSRSAGGVQPSCLALIEQSYQERGFSKSAAGKMARSQKPSTLGVYEGKWTIFCRWCTERNVNSLDSTPGLIADFLCYLRDKDLAITTIEGYRTAIAKVLKATRGLDIGKNTELSSLIANFQRNMPLKPKSIPGWDLSLVLKMLMKSPFEPMHLADIKFLTFKTVFLLALASGKRRSEIHALQSNIQRTENWSEISLFPDINFIPKTQLASEGPGLLKPLTLKAMTKFLSPDLQEDRSLCVVRAIKYYLSRTKTLRKDRPRLFIAIKKGHNKDICRNTVSSWIKKTILLAYAKASPEVQRLHRVKAHDVRAMASSWAFMKNVSLEAILQACSWRSHTTFTNFYLKDLTRIQDDLLKLVPFISAQH